MLKHSERFGKKVNANVIPQSIENARSLLNTDVTFTIVKAGGGSYTSFFEAVADLSDNYEINNTVTLELDPNGDVIIDAELPMFFGKGTLIIEGNNSTLSFVDGPTSTLKFRNHTAVNIICKNLTLNKGTATNANITVEGQNITFDNVNFTNFNVTYSDCGNLNIKNCRGTQPHKAYKSSLVINSGVHKLELYNCITELHSVEISPTFIVKGGTLLLNNPKFNYNYWVGGASIQNCSLDMTGWITVLNVGGGNTVTKNLLSVEACSINRLPFNIDLQGGAYTFNGAYVLKLVNCVTPAVFPAVSYNFSAHSFINNGAAIGLFSSSILPAIPGAVIYKDDLSIYNASNFDPSGTQLTSTTLSGAIKELAASLLI